MTRSAPAVRRVLAASALVSIVMASAVGVLADDDHEKPWERGRRMGLDAAGGLPVDVLAEQSDTLPPIATLDDAVTTALAAAAEAARPLIDRAFHAKGRRLVVPDAHATIQAALDAAQPGDTVVVKAGIYHELLTMKDGVLLISDASNGGDELTAVDGARLRLPKRALRTVVDGSKSEPSHHGMVDFEPGTGRHAIVDGFTFRSLPEQNHHIPGHAHGLNVRGASPVIVNCIVRGNGSTGIGNHVVYADQGAAVAKRDFRFANVRHQASAVIHNNVISGNLGLGIGCNHFSSPFVLGNEIFGNDDSRLGDDPSPGIGAKHGATPTFVGNIVHGNPGGGILCRAGAPQGAHPIDRRTRPSIRNNVVYANGDLRAGIACAAGGTEQAPVLLVGNHVDGAGAAGIGLSKGAFAVIEDNVVLRGKLGGIAVNGAKALRLNRNVVKDCGGPGFLLVSGSEIGEMRGNAAAGTTGPRFVLREAEVRRSPGED